MRMLGVHFPADLQAGGEVLGHAGTQTSEV
jgi:hypothetical protein